MEVHNAYGLTEAPLITINRMGRNRIETVGEPLPETEVTISTEGEVLVRDRQVMRSYHPSSSNEKTEWLSTGDLGRLTREGSLVLEGRIKEVMFKSYGKTIMPAKIESSLRQVPGVVDAMFVVVTLPYGTVLLWVERGYLDMPGKYWDEHMARLGSELSDPERPKAWAVLPYDLDIEKGEMTASLKLKRRVLLERYAPVIDSMYSDVPVPGTVVHLGREAR